MTDETVAKTDETEMSDETEMTDEPVAETDGIELEQPIDIDKPQLIVHTADYPATMFALRDRFIESGRLFDRGRTLVRLVTDGAGEMYNQKMAVSNVIVAAHDLCQPFKFDKDGDLVPITLPSSIAQMYLEHGEWGVKPLAGITTAPIMRGDGSITSQRGYDAATQRFVDVSINVEVPNHPTEQQARSALRRLRYAFRTFPFADAVLKQQGDLQIVDLTLPPGLHESSHLNVLLTAVARPSLHIAPAALFTAPGMSGSGTGKGLMVRGMTMVAFGIAPKVFPKGHDMAELDKRVVAALLSGSPAVIVDNVNGVALKSETLCSVLTERPAQLRVMGTSTMVPINSAAFVAITGNALKLTLDLVRRFLWVDINPRLDDPSLRPFKTGFLDSIEKQRSALLSDALTILRWGRLNAKQLQRGLPMGSFEEWAEWVRDPLLSLGCRDPVELMQQVKQADPERREIADLFNTWYQKHRDEPVASKDLDEAVLALINPQRKSTQFVTRLVQRLVETRYAGFVLTESRGGKWSPPTFALQLTASESSKTERDEPETTPERYQKGTRKVPERYPGEIAKKSVGAAELLTSKPDTPETPERYTDKLREQKLGRNGENLAQNQNTATVEHLSGVSGVSGFDPVDQVFDADCTDATMHNTTASDTKAQARRQRDERVNRRIAVRWAARHAGLKK